MKTGNTLLAAAQSEVPRRPVHSFRRVRWLNGGVHWISAVVLVYAFISNGETTHAMMNPVAMRGEVQLGLVVGLTFLIRFVRVRSMGLQRRAMGRAVCSNVTIQSQADN